MKRIKYVSQMAKTLSPEELEQLRLQCLRNNMDAGITGVLMASGGLFFQVVEGPKASVDTLWKKLLDDPRHADVLLLSSEENVRDRLFPDWAMEMVSLDESRADRLEPLHAILESVVQNRKTIGRLTSVLERSIWAELVHGVARLRAREEKERRLP
jgi:hypothetical protein